MYAMHQEVPRSELLAILSKSGKVSAYFNRQVFEAAAEDPSQYEPEHAASVMSKKLQ